MVQEVEPLEEEEDGLLVVSQQPIVLSIFIGQYVCSGQSGLTLQLFPMETIVTPNMIDQNHHRKQL